MDVYWMSGEVLGMCGGCFDRPRKNEWGGIERREGRAMGGEEGGGADGTTTKLRRGVDGYGAGQEWRTGGAREACAARVGHGSTRGYPNPRAANPYGSPAGVALPAVPQTRRVNPRYAAATRSTCCDQILKSNQVASTPRSQAQLLAEGYSRHAVSSKFEKTAAMRKNTLNSNGSGYYMIYALMIPPPLHRVLKLLSAVEVATWCWHLRSGNTWRRGSVAEFDSSYRPKTRAFTRTGPRYGDGLENPNPYPYPPDPRVQTHAEAEAGERREQGSSGTRKPGAGEQEGGDSRRAEVTHLENGGLAEHAREKGDAGEPCEAGGCAEGPGTSADAGNMGADSYGGRVRDVGGMQTERRWIEQGRERIDWRKRDGIDRGRTTRNSRTSCASALDPPGLKRAGINMRRARAYQWEEIRKGKGAVQNDVPNLRFEGNPEIRVRSVGSEGRKWTRTVNYPAACYLNRIAIEDRVFRQRVREAKAVGDLTQAQVLLRRRTPAPRRKDQVPRMRGAGGLLLVFRAQGGKARRGDGGEAMQRVEARDRLCGEAGGEVKEEALLSKNLMKRYSDAAAFAGILGSRLTVLSTFASDRKDDDAFGTASTTNSCTLTESFCVAIITPVVHLYNGRPRRRPLHTRPLFHQAHAHSEPMGRGELIAGTHGYVWNRLPGSSLLEAVGGTWKGYRLRARMQRESIDRQKQRNREVYK
ncbi:hypothetical protein C8R45DRAFT_942361 [Mycena sanguinolenta]|nr:hypothetical protein C8R45DRAFT_942361 [Mycena sanguinolenta]